MVAIAQTGIHFNTPWLMSPQTNAAAQLVLYDATNSQQGSDTVAFFTGLANFGVIDSTNWSSNTYKTIYSHTGEGLVAGMVACTAGGAETTTFEITIDGVLSTVTVTNASGERAALTAAGLAKLSDFSSTTVPVSTAGVSGFVLDSGTLSTFQSGSVGIFTSLRYYGLIGVPMLRYNISCLIRMKHSVSITNSTATAYSGVMVRKGIAS